MTGWARQVFSMELRQMFSYRVDFWVQFAGTLVFQLGMAYYLWSAVFEAEGLTSLGGYSFHGLMFYYLLVPLVDRLVRGHDFFQLSNEIYEGTLTRYLVYPVSFFSYKLVGQAARAVMSLTQMIIGITAFALLYGIPDELALQGQGILMAAGLGFAGAITIFFVSTLLEMAAFWAEGVWSLVVMLRLSVQLLSGGLVPLELFPEWARGALNLTFFPHLISTPIRLMTGRAGAEEFGFALLVVGAWGVLGYFAARLVWRRGSYQYTGVGM